MVAVIAASNHSNWKTKGGLMTTKSTIPPARLIALMLRGEQPEVKAREALPLDWRKLARALWRLEKADRVKQLETELGAFADAEAMKQAIYDESRKLDAPAHRKTDLGRGVSPGVVEMAVAFPLESPDEDLRRCVLSVLEGPQGKGEKRPSARVRRLAAGKTLLDWLNEHGGFVQSEAGQLYYFWRDERVLYGIETDRFAGWLYTLTGVNPACQDYRHLLSDCKTAALDAPVRPVVRLAAWDNDENRLYVSRFDGSVYVMDGNEIREEGNGEGPFIFNDDPLWVPYEPDLEGNGEALRWFTDDLPNWDVDRVGGDPEAQTKARAMSGLKLRAWILSAFFCELCPTRPMLVYVGEMGSGKSSQARMLLRFLFGPSQQVGGVPDKEDGFTTWASNAHFVVLDNLDQFVSWLRDKLARICTGAEDVYRKLYSNNEQGRVVYRCWPMVTSRSPDTLRRDDLADRMVMVHLARLDPSNRQREMQLAATRMAMRDSFWGDLLLALNQAVLRITQNGLQGQSSLRMADWEALGRVFARNESLDELWAETVAEIGGAQQNFLLEDDILVEAIYKWLEADPDYAGKRYISRELHAMWTALMFPDSKPSREWPKSAKGMGKKLANMRRALQSTFDVDWTWGTLGKSKNTWVYQFWPKGKQPPRQEQAGLVGMEV